MTQTCSQIGKTWAAIIVLILTFSGCSRHQSEFQSVPIKVVDESTGAPVVGAAVKVVCMGLSPYRTNTYQTDVQGMAQVMAYIPGQMVNVEAAGYESKSGNVIVRLKRNQ